MHTVLRYDRLTFFGQCDLQLTNRYVWLSYWTTTRIVTMVLFYFLRICSLVVPSVDEFHYLYFNINTCIVHMHVAVKTYLNRVGMTSVVFDLKGNYTDAANIINNVKLITRYGLNIVFVFPTKNFGGFRGVDGFLNF